MNRILRIASTLALASFVSVLAPAVAAAGSPLLSGYGGPGGGEQSILGSALLGGAGPDGSSGSGGSGGAGSGGSAATTSGGSGTGLARAGEPAEGLGSAGTGGTGAGGAASRPGGGSTSNRGGAHTGRNAGTPAHGAGARAYVSPSSLRLASADSSALEISGGDVLLLVATIATLGLVGVLTIRWGRLQQ
ncbi:MAG: hypothetical protein WBQ21_01910 [Solirubrobacteraceae bacterium]